MGAGFLYFELSTHFYRSITLLSYVVEDAIDLAGLS